MTKYSLQHRKNSLLPEAFFTFKSPCWEKRKQQVRRAVDSGRRRAADSSRCRAADSSRRRAVNSRIP